MVMEAVRTIRRELAGEVPLIGFAGSPHPKDLYGGRRLQDPASNRMMAGEPQTPHALLASQAESVCLYLECAGGGAQSLSAFDTWGKALNASLSRVFARLYVARIVDAPDPAVRGAHRSCHSVYQKRRPVVEAHRRDGL